MRKRLYVGRLRSGVTASDLTKMFAAHGAVESARIIVYRDADGPKALGVVEMKTDEEARAAIAAVNGDQDCVCIVSPG